MLSVVSILVRTHLPNRVICLALLLSMLSGMATAQSLQPLQKPVIHLISLSSAYNEQDIPKIVSVFMQKGYEVKTDYLNQYVSDLGYVNVDEIRAKNLINALTDEQVDILWIVRGGGGALNLLPYLKANLKKIRQASPKTVVGFSDVTAVHMFINKYLPQWKSVHGIVANYSQELDPDLEKTNINDLEPIPDIPTLLKEGVTYENLIPLNDAARKGVKGILTGGNLELVHSTFGTEFSPSFTGKVLLLEDVGISYRQLDRTLNQLIIHIEAQKVAGVMVGQMYPIHGSDADRLIYKHTVKLFAERFPKPVYYYPNIGHGRKNHPVLLGGDVTISCADGYYCQLTQ